MILGMKFLPKFDCCGSSSDTPENSGAIKQPAEHAVESVEDMSDESHLLKTIGWVSAALGAVALGLLVGRELRVRYKFNRRTPYDMYSHSGDELPDVDCGVGI